MKMSKNDLLKIEIDKDGECTIGINGKPSVILSNLSIVCLLYTSTFVLIYSFKTLSNLFVIGISLTPASVFVVPFSSCLLYTSITGLHCAH